jgi:hypothetical protein
MKKTAYNFSVSVLKAKLFECMRYDFEITLFQTRGVGSFEKLGGPGFEGHFSRRKRASKKFFWRPYLPPPPLGQCSILGVKEFSGHPKNFPDIPKNFTDI